MTVTPVAKLPTVERNSLLPKPGTVRYPLGAGELVEATADDLVEVDRQAERPRHDLSEVLLLKGEELDVGPRLDAGRPGQIEHDRNLAVQRPRLQRRHRFGLSIHLPNHLGLSLEQDQELVSRSSLANDRLTGSGGDRLQLRGD